MKNYFLLLCSLIFVPLFSQVSSKNMPKIMVIPFTKDKEDIRTILDGDVNRRIAITKVKEGFDIRGYTTVDFVGKLKAVRDNRLFTSDNQSDIKSKIIEISGSDIYVITEVNTQQSNNETGVNVIVSSYETSTGNSLANKVCSSGKFATNDVGKLTARAVDKCIDDFVYTMDTKFREIEKNGRSILVDFSFSEDSPYTMTYIMPAQKMALSDMLENWIYEHSFNSNYHIQGTTKLRMIFDDIRIPLKDENGNNYTTNRYALLLYKYLQSVGLNSERIVKGNTIYITIN